MVHVTDSLACLEGALTRLGRHRLFLALRPGLSASDVHEITDSIGLKSNADLEALLGWHDGTSIEGVTVLDDIQLFPGFYMLSLEDAAANYRAFVADRRWAVGWLPLFANGGGDFYVVDLRSGDQCPVRHFRIEETEHPVEFASIDDMLRTLVQAFERGVFFLDSRGYLEMSDLEFAVLAAELNPQIDWWRD